MSAFWEVPFKSQKYLGLTHCKANYILNSHSANNGILVTGLLARIHGMFSSMKTALLVAPATLLTGHNQLLKWMRKTVATSSLINLNLAPHSPHSGVHVTDHEMSEVVSTEPCVFATLRPACSSSGGRNVACIPIITETPMQTLFRPLLPIASDCHRVRKKRKGRKIC